MKNGKKFEDFLSMLLNKVLVEVCALLTPSSRHRARLFSSQFWYFYFLYKQNSREITVLRSLITHIFQSTRKRSVLLSIYWIIVILLNLAGYRMRYPARSCRITVKYVRLKHNPAACSSSQGKYKNRSKTERFYKPGKCFAIVVVWDTCRSSTYVMRLHCLRYRFL